MATSWFDFFKNYYFLILLVLQLACSFRFYQKQNQGALIGGAISWPKSLWLFYAIFSWYLVPFGFFFFEDLDTKLKTLLAIHLLSWWIRGPIELVMIYKLINWSPRYGIAHDIGHALFLLTGCIWAIDLVGESAINQAAYGYIFVTFIMTLFETYFAKVFFEIRGEAKKDIYFASTAPEWKRANQMTVLALSIAIPHQIFQIVLVSM